MKSYLWLSFDLGFRGDYEGIYQFLDTHMAKECGNNVAVFEYEWKKDLVAELLKELAEYVTFDKRARLYLVSPGEKGRPEGRFIKGSRKRPLWTGYTASNSQEVDADA